ncbi:MAG: hypothetical protein K8R85_12395 [Bacteroidetes bacterium]|nr:hypothetical protein [Bacteroidota bacterium]
MKKLTIIRTFILGLLLLTAVVANAQQEKVQAAYVFLEQNKLDSAKANIDAAVIHPETVNDALAWYVRGFIYKSIYNTKEKGNKRSPSRLEGLYSFKKSLSLDAAKEYFPDNIGGIKYFASTFRNDAAESLDPIDYRTAIELFNKSQECSKIVDPSPTVLQANQTEFDFALVSVYNSVLENDNKDSARVFKFFTLAKNVYNKILALEPNNIQANIGMGKLYYNQAVNIIKSLDIDTDITKMDIIEENTKKLGTVAEPFMKTAHDLDPKREDAIIGLTGIYYILHEDSKYNIFKQKLEDIKKPK